MSEAANDSDYLRDRAIIESYPDDKDVRLTGAEFKKLMMNRLESDTRFRAMANSAIEYLENAPPAPIIIAEPALQAKLAECDRLRKMTVEAAANFKKGAICADCTGDGGSDYPHTNDRAREALNAALEANRKYEEGK